MCHRVPLDANFWCQLFEVDQRIADQVRAAGCSHCAGKLHVANYPRKPRGEHRQVLGEHYHRRLSFCCSTCRKRTTPPSVRFLGRKVYLGAIVVLLSAGVQVLSEALFNAVLQMLNLPAQTLHRWRSWWSNQAPISDCLRRLSGWFSPPIRPNGLPGELLFRLQGVTLALRLKQLLLLISPLTTSSCAHYTRVFMDTHKM